MDLEKYINIDFYKGFQHSLKNAHNHLKVAENSTEICYGIAYGQLVLAAEEALKAMMLFNIHYDPSVLSEIDDFDDISPHR